MYTYIDCTYIHISCVHMYLYKQSPHCTLTCLVLRHLAIWEANQFHLKYTAGASIFSTCTKSGVLSSTVLNGMKLDLREPLYWPMLWEWTRAWKYWGNYNLNAVGLGLNHQILSRQYFWLYSILCKIVCTYTSYKCLNMQNDLYTIFGNPGWKLNIISSHISSWSSSLTCCSIQLPLRVGLIPAM